MAHLPSPLPPTPTQGWRAPGPSLYSRFLLLSSSHSLTLYLLINQSVAHTHQSPWIPSESCLRSFVCFMYNYMLICKSRKCVDRTVFDTYSVRCTSMYTRVCVKMYSTKTFMLLSWCCPFRAWKELADKTVYQNGSIDTSIHPPLFSLDSTFKSHENLFIKIAYAFYSVLWLHKRTSNYSIIK
jgi:hypothetical protein